MDIEKIVREYVDKSLHMSLATVSGDRPWVCEVHFTYDEDLNLYFRSKKSRRHSVEITKNPNVAGNIVRQHAVGEYPAAVYFEGKAAPIESEEERKRLFPYFQARLNVNGSILDDAKNEEGHQFYKISVENWYAFGSFDGNSGQKYKLAWHGGNT